MQIVMILRNDTVSNNEHPLSLFTCKTVTVGLSHVLKLAFHFLMSLLSSLALTETLLESRSMLSDTASLSIAQILHSGTFVDILGHRRLFLLVAVSLDLKEFSGCLLPSSSSEDASSLPS